MCLLRSPLTPRTPLFPYTTLFRSPNGAKPNLCPDALMDLTRGKRKSHSSVGAQKGARKPPLAPSTWIGIDRKSTRLNSSHVSISYAVFCLKKKNKVYRILAIHIRH